MLRVEVVYATPDRQVRCHVVLAEGATVRGAIDASGLPERFPEIDLKRDGAGVYGVRVPLDATVRDGDRIEILRPLSADPKTQRRRRAARRSR